MLGFTGLTGVGPTGAGHLGVSVTVTVTLAGQVQVLRLVAGFEADEVVAGGGTGLTGGGAGFSSFGGGAGLTGGGAGFSFGGGAGLTGGGAGFSM